MTCPTSDSSPTSVYRYYDKSGILIYVGITNSGSERNKQHNADKEWWRYVNSQDVDHYQTREPALIRERDLILEFRPPFNIHHNAEHHVLKSAYLGFQMGGYPDKDPLQLGRDERMALRLYVFPQHGRSVDLLTRLEHVAITATLKTDSIQAAIYNGQPTGIVKVEKRGPVLKFNLTMLSARIVVRYADLKIGWITKEQRFEIKKIRLFNGQPYMHAGAKDVA